MWATIGKALVQAAVWCLGHPDEVVKVVNVIAEAKKK
jgi:ABC-type nitrate/sulfonate/bicarbonate transport system substrate-binding protein